MTPGFKEVSRGRIRLASLALTTEVREFITCAEMAFCDIQDEGIRSHAEVTGALSQGGMRGVEDSYHSRALGGARCPWPQPPGPLHLAPGGQELSGARLLALPVPGPPPSGCVFHSWSR